MKFLILFLYFLTISFAYSVESPEIKNIVVYKESKTHKNVIFKDINNKNVDLKNFKNKLVMINFWATWCAPCLKEMPSLDALQSDDRLNNLVIIPINIGQEEVIKSINFFEKLDIKNLKIFYDPSIALAKKFSLRGVPTTIIINKNGEEFARIVGSIDFTDEEFIKWLENFN